MAKQDTFLFANDSTRFYFPWICVLMVFISTLLCGGGLLVYNSLKMWQQGVSESLTVQIETYNDKGEFRGDDITLDIEKTLSVLRTTPGVIGATVVDDAHMAELMAPWIGADVEVQELPLPKLIDVTIDDKNPPFLEQLKMDLSIQVPNVNIDSHRIWLSHLVTLSNRILQVIGVLVLLIVLTVIFTVAYTTKASLKIQEFVIRLVHMMGAKDLYITNKYAFRTLKRTLIGGLIGFVAALPILFAFTYCFKGMSNTIFVNNFSSVQWLLLVLTPFILALIAFITSFKTVLNYLRKFI